MADALVEAHPSFDRKTFIGQASKLNRLELKARVYFVRDQLQKQLPQNYKQALRILLQSLQGGTLKGFDLWPYTEFVQTYGLQEVKISLAALQELTCLFTSEFAVRPFIVAHPEETLAFLKLCTQNENPHIRRWASEGSRPRLPWGTRLELFIKDPRPGLVLLEKLKFDPELYVRKSVANHLNDIAKDHPQIVTRLLKKWQTEVPMEHQEKLNWITRHSLRTLIKQGHPQALQLIGADTQAQVRVQELQLQKVNFRMNDKIEFSFLIRSTSKKKQKLVIDYVIHHRKANQETSAKVFKLKTLILDPGQEVNLVKNHHLKPISTRKYYSGLHILEIQVNGKIQARTEWNLKL